MAMSLEEVASFVASQKRRKRSKPDAAHLRQMQVAVLKRAVTCPDSTSYSELEHILQLHCELTRMGSGPSKLVHMFIVAAQQLVTVAPVCTASFAKIVQLACTNDLYSDIRQQVLSSLRAVATYVVCEQDCPRQLFEAFSSLVSNEHLRSGCHSVRKLVLTFCGEVFNKKVASSGASPSLRALALLCNLLDDVALVQHFSKELIYVRSAEARKCAVQTVTAHFKKASSEREVAPYVVDCLVDALTKVAVHDSNKGVRDASLSLLVESQKAAVSSEPQARRALQAGHLSMCTVQQTLMLLILLCDKAKSIRTHALDVLVLTAHHVTTINRRDIQSRALVWVLVMVALNKSDQGTSAGPLSEKDYSKGVQLAFTLLTGARFQPSGQPETKVSQQAFLAAVRDLGNLHPQLPQLLHAFIKMYTVPIASWLKSDANQDTSQVASSQASQVAQANDATSSVLN